jgi:hypothetical protein
MVGIVQIAIAQVGIDETGQGKADQKRKTNDDG